MKTNSSYKHSKLLVGIGMIVSVIAMLAFSPASADAKGKPKTSPRTTPAPITITSVTGNSVTIKDDKTTKTYSVSTLTEVTVNGQRASVADLKPGMVVSVTLRDPANASRIVATGQ